MESTPTSDKSISQGFIRYQSRSKKSKHSEYGIYCKASRVNGKKINNDVWLGKVVDKKSGVFYTKERGLYKFIIPDKFETINSSPLEYYSLINNNKESIETDNNKYDPVFSVQFGAVYAISEVLKKSGLIEIFTKSFQLLGDDIFALILYKITDINANCYVYNWWRDTYARFLFPKLKLQSQRISEILDKISSEHYFRMFFEDYLSFIKTTIPNSNILIDSTGLPNDISIDLTKLNNHNGQKSNEIRLILVMEETTGYPLYFRYVPGNIVDVSTLTTILEELDAYNVPLNSAIMDAGYYSENNIRALYERNITFMTRSIPNRLMHKELISTYGNELEKPENLIDYQDRRLFIKKVPYNNSGMSLFAYICLDINEYHSQRRDVWNKYDNKVKDEDLKSKLNNCGKFILVSSRDIETKSLLSAYYSRQAVEQLFDYAKNDLDLLPLRNQNEDTLRGHLLICFMATVAHTYLTNFLLKSKKSLKSILRNLNRYNCEVFTDRLIPNISNKDVNDAFKALKIEIPSKIMINS